MVSGEQYKKILSSILDEMQMTQLYLAGHQDHLVNELLTLENDPFNPTDVNGRALTGLATVRDRDRYERGCTSGTRGETPLAVRDEGLEVREALQCAIGGILVSKKLIHITDFMLLK